MFVCAAQLQRDAVAVVREIEDGAVNAIRRPAAMNPYAASMEDTGC